MRPFLPILLFVLGVALVLVNARPAWPRIKALQEDIFFLEDTLERARELQSVRDRLLTKYNSFTPNDIERLHKLLPDNVDNVRLIIDIDEMANRYGLTIQDIDISQREEPSARVVEAADEDEVDFGAGARALRESVEAAEGVGEPHLSSLSLSFSVRASYERFLAFLRDLERSLRIVDITRLSFGAGEDAIAEGYVFQVSLKTYWLQ